MHGCGSGAKIVVPALPGSKDSSGVFRNLRALQRRVLSVLAAAGRSMYLREIAEVLHRDRRRVHDALKRLLRRGLVERLSGGRYRVPPVLRHAVLGYLAARYRSKDSDGTGVPCAGRAARVFGASRVSVGVRGVSAASVGGAGSVSVRLDNVRGWRGATFYRGDRFGDRDPGFLGLLDRVSYFEVSLKWDAPRNEVFTAVYYDRRLGSVKVEFRPYSGDRDVARGDWRSVLRRGALDMLRWALRALKVAVRELGIGVFAEAVAVAREELGPVASLILPSACRGRGVGRRPQGPCGLPSGQRKVFSRGPLQGAVDPFRDPARREPCRCGGPQPP